MALMSTLRHLSPGSAFGINGCKSCHCRLLRLVG